MLSLWRDFLDNPIRSRYLWALLAVNIPGSYIGYLWYEHQLAANPVYFWPVIPDSPLSTTLFSIALILLLIKKERANKLFQLIAYTAVVKYGIWAVVVLTLHWLDGGTIRLIDVGLWLSHLGMAVQGGIFWRWLVYGKLQAYLTWGWMYFNDFMDYVVGLHPYLPNYAHWNTVMIFTVSLTTLLGYIAKRKSSLLN